MINTDTSRPFENFDFCDQILERNNFKNLLGPCKLILYHNSYEKAVCITLCWNFANIDFFLPFLPSLTSTRKGWSKLWIKFVLEIIFIWQKVIQKIHFSIRNLVLLGAIIFLKCLFILHRNIASQNIITHKNLRILFFS